MFKELHENIAASIQTQSLFQKKVNLGIIPGDIPTKEGVQSLNFLINSYETWLYKEQFENAYRKEEWNLLSHTIFQLENQNPVLACSQLFSVDYIKFGEDVLRIILNIFPITENSTIAVFSYTIFEKDIAADYIKSKIYGEGYLMKYLLSKLIIENTSNLFIKPKVFKGWNQIKRSEILEYYKANIFEFNDKDSSNYYLFE